MEKTPEIWAKQLLTGKDVESQREAAIYFAKHPQEAVIDVLVKSLAAHEDVSIFSIYALIQLGIHAEDRLVEALNSKNALVRKTAAEALGEIGSKKAVLKLIELLNDPVREVRLNSIEALGMIRDERSIAPLKEMLAKATDENFSYIALALTRLGRGSGLAEDAVNRYLAMPAGQRLSYAWAVIELCEKKHLDYLIQVTAKVEDHSLRDELLQIIQAVKLK